MSAPWTKNQNTMEKVEERVFDWLDQLNLDEHLSDLKDQIASSEHVDTLREHVPGLMPARKSHKRRNALLLVLVGAGAAAIVAARHKASVNSDVPAPFASPVQPPVPQATNPVV